MEIIIRDLDRNDFDALDEHLKLCFGTLGEGYSFFTDFPIWIDARDGVLRKGIFISNKLIAFAGGRSIHFGQGARCSTEVGMIGGVSTQEGYRGLGFANRLLDHVEQGLADRGCVAAYLWGAMEGLYAQRGYRPCGVQRRLRLQELLQSPLNKTVATEESPPIGTGMTVGLANALVQRQGRFGYSVGDQKRIFEFKNIEWRWLGTPDCIQSYIGFRKGIDLPHQIHEWGGNWQELLWLFAGIFRQDPQAELLTHPSLLPQEWRGLPGSDEYLCLSKSLQVGKLPKNFEENLWFWGMDSI